MRRIFLLLTLLFTFTISNAQRYLKPIFQESKVSKNIKYGENINYLNFNEKLFLDIYEPKNDTETQRPVIVYVHAGGFTDKNQSKDLLHIIAFADSFARRGYVVATINYRLDSSISNRAVINAMHDSKAAIRFLRKNAVTYKLDSNFIFIGGESAGAITSLTSAYNNEIMEMQYPPTNPQSLDKTIEGNSGNDGYSSKTTAVLCFCGGTKTALNELLFDTSAMENSKDAPILFLHGTKDNFISILSSLEVAQRANNLGIPQLYYPLHGATHCPWFYPLTNSWKYLDTLVDYTSSFLYAFVKDKNTRIMEHTMKEKEIAFPNPSYGDLFIPWKNKQEYITSIIATNMLGQIVQIPNHSKVQDLLTIDTSSLPKGIYIISIKKAENASTTTFRFIKL